MLDFHVLGSLEIDRGGDLVPFGPAKQRALLAVLLVHTNEVLSVERLADELWGARPPRSAGHALQVHVSNLRKLLGPGLIVTRPPGYLLQVAPQRVDALRFETLAREGRRALEVGEADRAAATLGGALALWRGPAFAGVDTPACTREATRLQERRLAATADRIEAELALGRAAALIAELEGLVAAHPLDERLRAQLILALYRSGRQAEALHAYDVVRRALRDQLGVDPGPELRRLHAAVLRQDERLTLDPAAQVEPVEPVEARSVGVAMPRTLVTAVAADITGTAALAERLEPADARLVLEEAAARLRAALEIYGGVVATTTDLEVTGLFGETAVHEDDPERAVRAALEMVGLLASYGAEVAAAWDVPPLKARAGVSTTSTTSATGATREAVRRAQELRARAASGDVLVGEPTRRLTERLFEWRPAAGAGDPDQDAAHAFRAPVAAGSAHQVLRPRGGAGKGRGLHGVEAELIGREGELRAGIEAVDAVIAGCGGIVSVTGEAGVGKSRLLAELRRHFERAGRGIWFQGTCLSYGDRLAYWPFRELLREWLGTSAQQPELRVRVTLRRQITTLFGDEAPAVYPPLATILGLALERDAAERVAVLSPDALQRVTIDAVRELLRRLAADRPVVAAFDDLHWADGNSVQLLEQLLPLTDEAAVLLVLAQRPERDRRSWRLQQLAARDLPHRTWQVALEPLVPDSSAALLTALVGPGTLPEYVHHRLLQAAEGNPFYLEELVRALISAGALVPDVDGWRYEHDVDLEIPRSVDLVIRSRIDRLGPPCQAVLSAASVLGREFSLDLLAAVCDDDELAGRLRELQRHDLIREARRWPRIEYRFRHALIQEAAYRSLVDDRRRELHRRAARALETLFPDRLAESYGVLARHCQESGERTRAVSYHRLAGEAARAMHALDAALAHYTAGLQMLDDLEDPAARSLVPQLRIGRGKVLQQAGDLPAAESELHAALASAVETGDRTTEHLVLHDLGLLHMYSRGRREQALAYFEKAAAVAEADGDRLSQVQAVSRIAVELANQLRLTEALAQSNNALAVARAMGDDRAVARALDCRKLVALYLGDLEGLRGVIDELVPILRRRNELWYLQFALIESAVERAAAGDWEAATARMEEGLAVNNRIGNRVEEPLLRSMCALLLRGRGSYDAARELGEDAVTLASELGNDWFIGWAGTSLGIVLCAVGASERAAAHLRQARDAAERQGDRQLLFRSTSHLAWASWLNGARADALALAECSEALLAEVSTPPGMAFLYGADAYCALARLHLARGAPGRTHALLVPIAAAAEASRWTAVAAECHDLLEQSNLTP